MFTVLFLVSVLVYITGTCKTPLESFYKLKHKVWSLKYVSISEKNLTSVTKLILR